MEDLRENVELHVGDPSFFVSIWKLMRNSEMRENPST